MSNKTVKAAPSAVTKTTDVISKDEIASYVGKNSVYYQTTFEQMDKKKSENSWNWAAFFFATPWLIFRKMYKQALILLAIFFVLNSILFVVFFVDQGHEMVSITKDYRSGAITDQEFAEKSTATDSLDFMPYIKGGCAISAVILLIHVCFALKANSIYRKKVLADISTVRKEASVGDALIPALQKKGGTAFSKVCLIMLCYILAKLIFIVLNIFYYYDTMLNGII